MHGVYLGGYGGRMVYTRVYTQVVYSRVHLSHTQVVYSRVHLFHTRVGSVHLPYTRVGSVHPSHTRVVYARRCIPGVYMPVGVSPGCTCPSVLPTRVVYARQLPTRGYMPV